MAKKDIRFTLDTIDSKYSPVGTVKQLDSVFFYIKITENGVTKDLTRQTIKLFAVKEDKKLVEQTTKINITNPTEGLVEIELLNSAIQVHGFTYFELEISDNTGIISTSDFILRVDRRVGSDEAIESTNEVATLKEIEIYVAQAKKEIKEFKNLQNEMLKTNETINKNEKSRVDAEELRVEAENNRSSNIKQIRELVSSGSMKITFNERDGYLTVDGSFNTDNRLHCKVTNKIYCEEGWIFSYYGRAETLAISYIMYQGDSIKSTGQHNRVLTEVVIPEGVDSIVFSSFCEKEKEVDLRVSLVKPDILLKDNLMKSLESKLGIVELNNQIRDSLSYDNVHIYKEDMTKISNFYANSAGDLVAANNYACYELNVAEGDIYYYSGTIIYNLAPYHLCNSQNEVVEVGGDLKQHPTLTPFEYDFLIIPKGVTKLRVCSGVAGGDAKLSLFKKNLKAPITQNGISDMLNNHEYDGVGEYADVTSRYSIINGSYINSGGSLSKDAESQYSDYIDITNISSLYIDAHAKYSTRAIGIYDGDKMFLGLKGVPDTQNVVLWKKEPIIIANLKKEYPSVRFIRISSYQYNTYPIKIYEQKCNLVETVKYLESKIESIKISSNVLYGKKYVACGDSFTEGDFRGFVDDEGLSGKESPIIYDKNRGCYKTYPWWIAERNNMVLINEAKCGSTMALSKEYLDGTNPDINHRLPFSLSRYKQVPLDTDYLTLWFGLNETKTPLGTLSDTDNRTILGAWNVVLEYFLTNMPYCKIGIVISDGYLNDTFANGIISVAEYWGVPYLDLRNDPKVPLMLGGRGGSINLNPKARELRNKAFYVTSDNGHPNLQAHKYQSTFIENWLRSL